MISRRLLLLLFISGLGLFMIASKTDVDLIVDGRDPMERREEKLKALREKRDRFFKEDPNSPLKDHDRKGFKGLVYYSIDLKYAMIGKIDLYPAGAKPIYTTLPTNKGPGRKYVKCGRFGFKLEGRKHLLHIYRTLGSDEFFLPFKDKTSETETCREGRYLPIERMLDGRALIDFNRAYNPFCEFNEKFTCPLPPPENWLDIAIRAGEKRFR